MAYYFNQLSKIEQKAYYAMKEGLMNLAPSFTVPLLDGKTLSDIYFMVRMDHPEIFWSVKFSYRYYKDSDHAEMIPEYSKGEMFIPLRECFEKLGYNVVWTENGNVVIYKKSISLDDETIKRFAGKM